MFAERFGSIFYFAREGRDLQVHLSVSTPKILAMPIVLEVFKGK